MTVIAWTITATVWAGILALAGIWVLNRVFAWYHSHGRHPRTQEPGEHHEGATEDFGAELHALRDLPPAPELVTDVETEARWGQIWHDFERDLMVQIDEVFAPYLGALTGPLDAKTCMELDAVLAAA